MYKRMLFAGMALLIASFQVSAITIHTDLTSFNTALGANLLNEDFEAESGSTFPHTMNGTSDLESISTTAGGAGFVSPGLNGTVFLSLTGSNQVTTYTFSQDIVAFGIEVRDYFEYGGTQLNFSTSAGESGTLLDLFGTNYNFQYAGISDAIAFSSITITGTTDDNGQYDNIGYALAAPVPEPATLVLLAIGLVGIGARKRKIH